MYLRTVTQTNFRDNDGNPIMLNNKPLPNISFNEDETCCWKGKAWWDAVIESNKGNSQEWHQFQNGKPWVEIDKDCDSDIEVGDDLIVRGLMDVIYTMIHIPEKNKITTIDLELYSLVIVITKNLRTSQYTIDIQTKYQEVGFDNSGYDGVLAMILEHYRLGIDVNSKNYREGIINAIRSIKEEKLKKIRKLRTDEKLKKIKEVSEHRKNLSKLKEKKEAETRLEEFFNKYGDKDSNFINALLIAGEQMVGDIDEFVKKFKVETNK